MKRALAIAALVLSVAWGDTLILRNGRTVNGSYLGGDSRQIRVAVGDRIESFSVADVVRLEFGSLASPDAPLPSQTPRTQSSPPPPLDVQPPVRTETREPQEPRDRERTLRTDRGTPPPYASPRGSELPPGTTLTVRMIDPVDSRTDRLGQTYRASLDEPLMVNGDVVVPRGADVIAKLVNDKQSGRATGETVLTLDLESITVDGRIVPISTEDVTRTGSSTTRRTGIAAGGLGALGAIIGGIAGGGRGAAIGAVSGAGAGAAGSVLMKGEQVHIPSETRLTFSLQQPLRI